MNGLVSSLCRFAVSLQCQCLLMDQVFLEVFFCLFPHSIAINMVISGEKICFDLKRKIFFLKKETFTLYNWLTVWENVFSAYIIQKSIPDVLKNYI